MELFFSQVGLAVGDTEMMKKYATIERLGMQLQHHIQIEEAYPTFIIRRAYQMVYVEKPNKLPRSYRCGISLNVFISVFCKLWCVSIKGHVYP